MYAHLLLKKFIIRFKISTFHMFIMSSVFCHCRHNFPSSSVFTTYMYSATWFIIPWVWVYHVYDHAPRPQVCFNFLSDRGETYSKVMLY